jgi:hypothetical protein
MSLQYVFQQILYRKMSFMIDRELVANYAFYTGICTAKMLGLSLLTAG